MTDPVFSTPIEYLKGVGPQRAEALKKEANIHTYLDLLLYFPFRYIDKTAFSAIAVARQSEQSLQLKVRLISVQEIGTGRKKRLSVMAEDQTGKIELVWFKGVKWVKPNLHVGKVYSVYGKPTMYAGKPNIAHPEITLIDPSKPPPTGMQPVYHSTEKLSAKGLNSKGFEKIIHNLLPLVVGKIEEVLPPVCFEQFSLMDRSHAYLYIHRPKDETVISKARFRLKFEELLFVQLELLMNKQLSQKKYKGFVFGDIGEIFNRFYKEKLPFELTDAQKRVIKEIRKDMSRGIQMNRLLQGDVGSGKTLVALMTLLIAIDNGFQTALMAPTEILAQQHFETLLELCEGLDIRIELLTGSVKQSIRTPIHEGLEDHTIHILIGTHALLEDKVKFANLGMVVIDEQHRFGVAQRARLWKKNTTPPHMLVMTATPIPRTLAMTLYGDLDISIIDELPPGRKPIQTVHRFENSRLKVFGFIEEQIKLGRQVYIVYPLIEESEKLDLKNLNEGFEAIERRFPKPNYQVSIVHGKMKPEAKDYEMRQFAEGKTHIMVATTVIEVGVNVPNASVMIIENAERFGLSQLHQLRGRVGRGADQSYCILMTDYKLSKDGKTRLETMVRTNDGFEIAEVDLKLRGPGDLMGTKQSGVLDLKLADLAKDQAILSAARNMASQVLKKDPMLKSPENRPLAKVLLQAMKSRTNWSRIS